MSTSFAWRTALTFAMPVIVTGIALTGTFLYVHGHAEDFRTVSTEAEQATLSRGVTISNDGSASSQKAIVFGDAGSILFNTDYTNQLLNNDGIPGNWAASQSPAPGRISVVTATNTPGADLYKPAGSSMRVELRPGDRYTSSGYVAARAEVYGRSPATFGGTAPKDYPDPVDTIRWYRFDIFMPKDYIFATDAEHWEDIVQLKGVYGGSPPIALDINRNQWRLGGTRGNNGVFENNGLMGVIATDRWTRIVIGLKLTTDPNSGWIEAYVNGVQKIAQQNVSTMDTQTNGLPDPIYLKQGIYRSTDWDALNATHVLHFGDTLVGTTKEAVF